MGKQPQNRPFQLSDYNEPTEPLEQIVAPFYTNFPFVADGASSTATTVPNAQPQFPAFPAEAWPVDPSQRSPQAAYPVLPPSPLKKYRGHPPGGAPPVGSPGRVRKRRSPLPGLVRWCFVLVQLALLVRIVCLLFGVQNTTLWLTLLFAASDLFVLPMGWLAANIHLSVLAGTPLLTSLEFLVAILAYGLCSRVLVSLLRKLLN